MKKIKIVLFLLMTIILTGCRGTYNIKINNDLSLDEELAVTISNKEDYYTKTENIFKSNNVDKKKYKITPSKETIRINYKEKYESIEDYLLNSKLYRNVFDKINYTKSDKELYINSSAILDSSNNISSGIVNKNNIDLLQINIEVPEKIISSNADTSTDNTLSWVIKKNDTKKEMNFKINIENSKAKRNKIIILSLITLIVVSLFVFVIVLFRKHKKIN